MPQMDVGGLRFWLPEACEASKYDEWAFYRDRWSRLRNGVKAVDLLICDPSGTAWFVEVKDYRRSPRTKAIDLADEVADKVYDTLAALLPARANGDDPRAIDPANVQQKLRQRIRPVDPHAVVCETTRMGTVPWTVV